MRFGANLEVTKIDVGPSAAPITPMLAASFIENPKNLYAIKAAMKIPEWATIPKISIHGLCKSGLKSIIAPTPIKIKRGKSSVIIPHSNRILSAPDVPACSQTTFNGRFTKIAPNPIGRRSIGS